ncbi:MAG TPA: capsule assembly Wzi family protein [Anaeromyxobacteraceae bacterium]|nr:capsule assembly Wzi family protein [Anaeromyxobacteraceae bacterium]
MPLAALLALAAAAAPASPLLPPDHWAAAAAERAHDMGLAPQWMPAQRAVPIAVVAEALKAAAAHAETFSLPLVHAWWRRFQEEFPRWPVEETRSPASPVATSEVGQRSPSPATAGEGRGEGPFPALLYANTALGYRAGWLHELPPAVPERPWALHLTAPDSEPFLDASAAAAYGPHLAAAAELLLTPSAVDLPSLELVLAAGPVSLSVGRAPVRYGPAQVGGVVMGGGAAIRRVEAMTTEPVRLPYLEWLGAFALDLALARFEESRHPYTPLLWSFQLSWRPHPRLTLAAIRGFMFGGAIWEGIGASDGALAILGIKNVPHSGNNVYSGSVRWRLPTEAALPLTARLEWGTDDNPGAAFNWPGLLAGLSTPLVPGTPVALGFEWAFFDKSGIGHHNGPITWYSHGEYVGGWATGQAPLGDPLGGNGRAWRLVAAADLLDARLHLDAVGAVNERRPDNLYAPQAGGRSVGASGQAEWRQGRYALGVRGRYEQGDAGWHRGDLTIRANVSL